MLQDDLRRVRRVSVCCRVDVRQRYAIWSGVTEDLSVRGCRVVTTQLPRLGASVNLTLSSDLLPEELDVVGEVVWIAKGRIGVLFQKPPTPNRERALSAPAWVEEVLQRGRDPRSLSEILVPAVQSAARKMASYRPRIVSASTGNGRRMR